MDEKRVIIERGVEKDVSTRRGRKVMFIVRFRGVRFPSEFVVVSGGRNLLLPALSLSFKLGVKL